MPRIDFEKSNRRAMSNRDFAIGQEKDPSLWRSGGDSPTEKQLKYLQSLCEQHEMNYLEPKTKAEASKMIQAIVEKVG